MRSIPSTPENTLDALDDRDVVTGVVAIRDQGLVARRRERSRLAESVASRSLGGKRIAGSGWLAWIDLRVSQRMLINEALSIEERRACRRRDVSVDTWLPEG